MSEEIMEGGEDRFHKKFTPHTYRTVFTTLRRNQGKKQHVLFDERLIVGVIN